MVFVLVPRLHLLDLAGAAQVFSTAADHGHPYRLSYVAEQPDVPTHQGVTLRAELNWPELGPGDLVVVPGWRAERLAGTGLLTAETLGRLTAHHAAGGTVASVCTGADALGR
ncbi:AraC family transcriptional regulator, partial [Actinoplanes sp. NPDC048791]